MLDAAPSRPFEECSLEECSLQEPRMRTKKCQRSLLLTCSLLFLFGLAAGLIVRWQDLSTPNLVAPSNDPTDWQLHVGGTDAATLVRDGDALRLIIRSADGMYDHLKLFQRGIDLKEGQTYTLRFRARADTLRDMKVEACLDQPDYHNVGLDQIAPLLPEWQEFSETFTAVHTLSSDTELPCFVVGNKSGTLWFRDISVTEAKVHADQLPLRL